MGVVGHDGLAVPGKVVLAHEPPFTIGKLKVDPATRQVEAAARRETLEPRVMQVLVALFRAGRIVNRDELIQRCWDGRVVGEDAINRVISRIRHVAGHIGGGSFTVETITKVGYRLVAENHQSTTNDSAVLHRPNRRTLIGGGIAAAAVGGLAWFRYTAPSASAVAEAKGLRDRAIALRQTFDVEDNRQAIAFLKESVRIAPEYGAAWGTLALAYNRALVDEPPAKVAGFRERMDEAIRNAERFDPGNADAEALRWLGFPMRGNLSDIEARARKFIKRHPDHPSGHIVLGNVLTNAGRWQDALPTLRVAKRLDGFNPLGPYQLAVAYWASGQLSRADEELDEASRRWPQHAAIAQTRIKVLALTGRPQAALSLAMDPQAQPFEPPEYQHTRIVFLQALATRRPGDVERAVEAALLRAKGNPNDCVTQGLNCVALGRIELGLSMLEGVYLRIGQWAWPKKDEYVSTHPLFQPHAQPLWKLPRFADILKRVGLETYWRNSNSQPDFRLT